MAEEKKKPLLGVFRTPAPTPPTAALSGKPADEPDKSPAENKAAPITTAPVKPVEPGKAPTDSKAAPTTGTTAPGKPADEKKPDEPGKASANGKTTPTTGTAGPG